MSRGHIRKRGRGYAVVVELERDPVTGKRRQKWQSANTKREAEALLTKTLHDLRSGAYVEPSTMTLGEYLQQWLEDYARHSTRPNTYAGYESLVRQHIVPALGNVPLSKLTPAQLQRLYSEKLDSGRADGRPGGLSPRSVRYLHGTLHEALRHAMNWGLIVRNPADAVQPPKQTRQEMKTWTADEASRFLATAKTDRLAALWMTALYTGMRRGDLLGLRWRDVDLTGGMVTVRQTLVERGGAISFSEPKTDRGRRQISIPASLVEMLDAHRERQKEQRVALGSAWEDHDLVFTVADGGPINPRNVFRSFVKLCENADVPKIRFHDLRHTHATLMLAQGVAAKVISDRLGHASAAFTLDTYAHALPDMQRSAADLFDAAVNGAPRQ